MSNAAKTALVKAPPKHVAPAKIRHEGGDHAQLYRDIERMTPEQRQVMLLQRAAGNEPVSRLVSRRRMPTVYGAGPRLTGSAPQMSARLGVGTAAGQVSASLGIGTAADKAAETGVGSSTATATAGAAPVIPGTTGTTSSSGTPPNGAKPPNGSAPPSGGTPPAAGASPNGNGATPPNPAAQGPELGFGAALAGAPGGVGAAAGKAAAGGVGEAAGGAAAEAAGGVGEAAGKAAAGGVGEAVGKAATGGVGQAAGGAAAEAAGGVGEAAGKAAAGGVGEVAGGAAAEAAGGIGAAAGKAVGSVGKAGGAAAKGAAGPKAKGAGKAAGGAAGGVGAAGGAVAGAGARRIKPAYKSVIAKIGQAKASLAQHGPAAGKVSQAHGAAVAPSNDVGSKAAAAQVGVMGAQKPKGFDRAGFIAAVEAAIAKATPSDGDEAEDFKSTGKTEQAKKEVSGLVKQDKNAAAGDIKAATDAPPPTAGVQPKQVTPMPEEKPGAPPKPIDAAAAMPDPRPKSETDLSAGPKQVSGEMAEADVDEQQLRKSNEPTFVEAADAKKTAEDNSKQAPKEFRAQEKGVLTEAKSTVGAESKSALASMISTKAKATGKVGKDKDQLKARDEAAHKEISTKIDSIYTTTKQETTAILDALDGLVENTFSSGEATARSAFETYVKQKFDAYKEDRYSGVGGSLLQAKDWAFGMPSEVNKYYADGHAIYIDKMKGVINAVADVVERELNRATARIAKGREDVKTYVEKLPKDQREFGREAMEKVSAQFDSLEEEVKSKGDDLVQTVAQKYKEADAAVNARIDEMKAENAGLVDKAINAVKGVVKTILQLKDMLLNVLSKAVSAVKAIIKDPIGFLGNLVNAVQAGLKGFVSRIGTHLKNALMDWLLGPIGEMGITMPKELDFKGILGLVLQLLGLTWQNIRAQLVKALGERAVSAMETAVDIVKTLATEGIGGLWKFLQDKIGDIKEQVLGQIKSFVIEKVVIGGITWLLSLLNPASAFVKACKAIYDIVMFIVERGSQIKEFIDAVLDSIIAISKGGGGGVPALIENTLAKMLPLAINFLASLLGLGGIGDKVRKIIETVRKPVNQAIQWLIKGVKKIGKKLFGGAIAKGKGLVAKGKAAYAKGKAYVKGKIEAGKKWAQGKVVKAKDWVKEKGGALKAKAKSALGKFVGAFSMNGAGHELSVSNKDRRLMMASVPAPVIGKLEEEEQEIPNRIADPVARETQLKIVRSILSDARKVSDIAAVKGPDAPEVQQGINHLRTRMSDYGRQFNRRGFGTAGWPKGAASGSVAEYGKQGTGGAGKLIHEHVVPSSLFAAMASMKRKDQPFHKVDRGLTTITWDTAAADVKTHGSSSQLGGRLNDNAALALAKAQMRSGTFDFSAFVEGRIQAAISARNTVGLKKPSDGEIVQAGHLELQAGFKLMSELMPAKPPAGSAPLPPPTDAEMDAAFSEHKP